MHRNKNIAVLCCAIAAGACAPALVHAVPMKLTNVAGPSMGGVYTSPYFATIGSTTGVAIYCDDFGTHVSIGDSWNATVTNMSALHGLTSPLGTLKFDTVPDGGESLAQEAIEQQDQYMEAARLAEQIAGSTDSTTAGQLSFALWSIFDPGALSQITGNNLTQANIDIGNAENQITLAGWNDPLDYSRVNIYTPDPTSASQEYLTVSPVPEPGTLSLLGFGVVAMVWDLRRRRSRYARIVA